jgi:uncharacterized membrane protein
MSSIQDGSSTSSLPYADRVRLVRSDQPFRWLALGWRDFITAPVASLCYGLLFAIVGITLTVGLWRVQATYLLLPLAGGFMLLGPALTLGFQAISRDLERHERPSFARALLAWRANAGPIFSAGLALMFLFLLWFRLAEILFALTFPHTAALDVQSLLDATFFTTEGLTFLMLFLVFGAAIAALVFTAGAFALPMLLGLVITLPLAGHAAWHAYRAVITPDAGS